MDLNTRIKLEELKKASEPLIKYIAENYDPHTKLIVDNNSAELLKAERRIINNDYIE